MSTAVKETAAIPEATFQNGLSFWSVPDRQLLIAGVVKTEEVHSVDVETGEHAVAPKNTYAAPVKTSRFGLAGSDGIKVVD